MRRTSTRKQVMFTFLKTKMTKTLVHPWTMMTTHDAKKTTRNHSCGSLERTDNRKKGSKDMPLTLNEWTLELLQKQICRDISHLGRPRKP